MTLFRRQLGSAGQQDAIYNSNAAKMRTNAKVSNVYNYIILICAKRFLDDCSMKFVTISE